jgi:septal ring factor EnvC (AmiA/AmiB activator)
MVRLNKNRMNKLLIALIVILPVQFVFAQPAADKARMERERQELQKELQEIQSNYAKVKGKSKATLGQLNIIRDKMNVQERYITNINKEIRLINDDIYLSNLEVNRLQVQLDTLKAQYARSLVYAYMNSSSYDFLNFIFSAASFNDALRRVSYLKSYRAYRQQQVDNIIETQQLIQDRKNALMGKQTQKKSALQNQQSQMNELEDQKKETATVMTKLRSQEKDLSKQITAKKKRDRQLASQIAAVIRREVEEARKKAEAEARARAAERNAANAGSGSTTTTTTTTPKSPKKNQSFLDLNAKDVALNASFEKNRGSLPWPVDNGVVSIPFGRSKVDNLDVNNPCITISTPSAGSPVKAVFDGEVSAVSNAGDQMVVIIRHGKYFTVYSLLASASVSKGDVVKRGTVVGRTGQADDGDGGQLEFYLMNEKQNVNPTPWLRR